MCSNGREREREGFFWRRDATLKSLLYSFKETFCDSFCVRVRACAKYRAVCIEYSQSSRRKKKKEKKRRWRAPRCLCRETRRRLFSMRCDVDDDDDDDELCGTPLEQEQQQQQQQQQQQHRVDIRERRRVEDCQGHVCRASGRRSVHFISRRTRSVGEIDPSLLYGSGTFRR